MNFPASLRGWKPEPLHVRWCAAGGAGGLTQTHTLLQPHNVVQQIVDQRRDEARIKDQLCLIRSI
jgi:hypothetical protein